MMFVVVWGCVGVCGDVWRCLGDGRAAAGLQQGGGTAAAGLRSGGVRTASGQRLGRCWGGVRAAAGLPL